jgi:hypothetical protein
MSAEIEQQPKMINTRLQSIISKLHNMIIELLSNKEEDKRKDIDQMFDEINELLKNIEYGMVNNIHKNQINILFNQTKLNMDKIKDNILLSLMACVIDIFDHDYDHDHDDKKSS